jgi:nicotinic acid phosphoribosyltransferase
LGIRLDSGDLAYLSIEARKVFAVIEKEFGVDGFGKMVITASNDLNEETIDALNKQVIVIHERRPVNQNSFIYYFFFGS